MLAFPLSRFLLAELATAAVPFPGGESGLDLEAGCDEHLEQCSLYTKFIITQTQCPDWVSRIHLPILRGLGLNPNHVLHPAQAPPSCCRQGKTSMATMMPHASLHVAHQPCLLHLAPTVAFFLPQPHFAHLKLTRMAGMTNHAVIATFSSLNSWNYNTTCMHCTLLFM